MHPTTERRTPPRLTLLLGDIAVVLLFAVAGTYHHGTLGPAHTVAVALPFALGWLPMAYLSGAFSGGRTRKAETFSLLGAWTVAAVIGLGLRSLPLLPGDAAPAFGFVSIAVGGSMMLLWRTVAFPAVSSVTG